eukprot:COSAG02_NODE_54441_length_296_cov_0.730964_1_plen_90_part_01
MVVPTASVPGMNTTGDRPPRDLSDPAFSVHTCDYRELNKVIQNHAYPLPEVTETIRALREQACESHRQDLENGVENPDLPAHVDKRGHDP